MKKPLIGISGGSYEKNKHSYVNENYIKAIYENGGIPIIIPISTRDDIIEEQIKILDGLILSGGEDISPLRYNEEPMEKLSYDLFIERDIFDFKLLKFAKERHIPILGICRGAQVMTVFHGGTLYQDLSYRNEMSYKHNQVENSNIETHSIIIEEDTLLHSIFEKEKITVNSFHHQAAKDIPENFIVSAKALDGVVEAIESLDYEFMLGLQWHPEGLQNKNEDMKKIFKVFIEEAMNQ